jgi:hypothetical protein
LEPLCEFLEIDECPTTDHTIPKDQLGAFLASTMQFCLLGGNHFPSLYDFQSTKCSEEAKDDQSQDGIIGCCFSIDAPDA